MPIMEWDDGLDVGVNNMNNEHQRLLALMNKLYDQHQDGNVGQPIIKTLTELQQLTITHFAHEEAFFDGINYPDAKKHKAIHKDLLTRLSTEAEKIITANGNIEKQFFSFLRLWLTAHIKGVDVKYGKYNESLREAS